ncbi:uncharacterized protein LOC122811021 [Protopterus annectens]|uniref:uncharacterized protein LOC122811021 n=1 Tax=Protopterus annectens TaxID=7888 RepID=UPI001CFC19F5|nr:uncharacterized protein LOC122811021 [Protopterus annectens]
MSNIVSFLTRVLFILLHRHTGFGNTTTLPVLSPQDILSLLDTSCVIALDPAASQDTMISLQSLSETAFHSEQRVTICVLSCSIPSCTWSRDHGLHFQWASPPTSTEQHAILFLRKVKDRTCLLPQPEVYPKGLPLPHGERDSLRSLLGFINEKCQTYRTLEGGLNLEGRQRLAVLNNLFTVAEVSDLDMEQVYNVNIPLNSTFKYDVASTDGKEFLFKHRKRSLPVCDRIPVPSQEDFVEKYLKRSKPVIIEGALADWPAMQTWTYDYLLKEYGSLRVHVKLAPNGVFEGCEKAQHFENFKNFTVPPSVRSQLKFPDLVVVCPATADVTFAEFLQMMQESSESRASAYLEYSSIPQYMPDMESDLNEFPFIKGLLTRKHLNLWLGDGNTLGKLHFDPFDNLLGQIKGRKEFIVFEPQSSAALYEGHIQEALLDFNKTSKTFQRRKVLDSTSMVMSPVDILRPDFKTFPMFSKAKPLNCTVGKGDVLFLPAFWWHEVQSYPSKKTGINLAVNFWYEPFLKKEFPCATCKLDINSFYRHLV